MGEIYSPKRCHLLQRLFNFFVVWYRDEINSAQSYGTWAGRRRLLDTKSKRFVNAVDIWYLGGEIKNGFGCFCPDAVMTIPASGGSSTKSSVKITRTPGGR